MTKRTGLAILPSALALALFAHGPAASAEKELHPIAAAVKAELKDPARPFTITVSLKVKDGAKLEAAFARALRATRMEKGCISYDLNRDAKDSTRYLVYERWRSLDALQAHLTSEHITTLLNELKDVLDGSPEVKVMLPAGE